MPAISSAPPSGPDPNGHQNRLAEQLSSRATSILLELDRTLLDAPDVDEAFPGIAELTHELLGARCVVLSETTLNPVDGELFRVSCLDSDTHRDNEPIDPHAAGVNATSRAGAKGHEAFLSERLILNGRTIGILTVASANSGFVSGCRLIIGQVAERLALAMRRQSELSRTLNDLRIDDLLCSVTRLSNESLQTLSAEMPSRFGDAVQRLIAFDHLLVTTIDQTRGIVVPRWVYGEDSRESIPMVEMPLAGTATEAVTQLRTGTIITRDAIENEKANLKVLLPSLKAGFTSMAAAPLIHHGQVIGAVIVRKRDGSGYSVEDVRVLERISVHLSSAVQNAIYVAHLRKVAYQKGLLAELGRLAISASDTDSVCGHLHQLLSNLIQFDRIVVAVFEWEQSSLKLQYVRGDSIPGYEQGTAIRIEGNVRSSNRWAAKVSAHKEARLHDPDLPGGLEENVQNSGLLSWIQGPIIVEDQLLGVLSLRSRQSEQYSERDLNLMEQVAAQVAPALAQAQRNEASEQETLTQAHLVELMHALTGASDQEEYFRRLCGQIKALIPLDRISVSLIDRNENTVEYPFSCDGDGAPKERGPIVSLTGTVTEVVVSTGRPMLLHDSEAVHGEETSRARLVALLVSHGFHSGLAVPMRLAGRIIGVLHIRSTRFDAYSQTHLRIASAIGAFIAPAFSRSSRNTPSPAVSARDEVTGTLVDTSDRMEGRLRLDRNPRILPGDLAESSSVPARSGVVIVDNHLLCRQAIETLLSDAPIDILASAGVSETVIDMVVDFQPAVLLWELHVGELNQLGTIREVINRSPETSVLVLSNEDTGVALSSALSVGASGFILKGVSRRELANSIQVVASGGSVIDPILLSHFLNDVVTGGVLAPNPEVQGQLESLDSVDRSILESISRGWTHAEIADELGFTLGTVKNRAMKLYRKIGVKDRAGAAVFAVRTGVIR